MEADDAFEAPTPTDTDDPARREDAALDELILAVIRQGGEVVVVPAERSMPVEGRAALLTPAMQASRHGADQAVHRCRAADGTFEPEPTIVSWRHHELPDMQSGAGRPDPGARPFPGERC
ncbi:hypothetical protein [Pseudomonas syringae]|nr:hypothetical protein [Pseudomonas syringae]